MKGLLTCFHSIAPSIKSEKLDVNCFDDAKSIASQDEVKIATRELFEETFSLTQKYETDDHYQFEGMLTMRASANKLMGAIVTTSPSGNSYGILADAAAKVFYLLDPLNGFQQKGSMSELYLSGDKFVVYFLEKQAEPTERAAEPKTPIIEVAPTSEAPTPAASAPPAKRAGGGGGGRPKKRPEPPTEKASDGAAAEPEEKKPKE